MIDWTDPFATLGLWWRSEASAGPAGDDAEAAALPVASPDETEDRGTGTSDWERTGRLSYDPRGGFELEVVEPATDIFAEWEDATLHGVSVKGTSISLINTRSMRLDGTAGGLARHRLRPTVVVSGKHIESLEDFKFTTAQFRLRGLREILWDPLRRSAGNMQPAENDRFLRVVKLPGAEVTFTLGWDRESSRHHERRERVATVTIELAEPLDFAAWTEQWLTPLNYLVVFASREPSRIEAFTVIEKQAPDAWLRAISQADIENLVDIVQPQSQLLRDENSEFGRVLFRLSELGDAFDGTLERWLDLFRALRPSGAFLFSTLTSVMFLEQRLISLTSAAEGYHRSKHDAPPLDPDEHEARVKQMLDLCTKEEKQVYRSPLQYANDASQRKRLLALHRRAGKVLAELGEHADVRVNEIVATRNYNIHHGERDSDVLDGIELNEALDRFLIVIQVNLMLDLEIPKEWIAAAIRRSYADQGVLRSSTPREGEPTVPTDG